MECPSCHFTLPDEIYADPEVIPITKLRDDYIKAAQELTFGQARYLVDAYYQAQKARIEAVGQKRASVEAGEPVSFITLVAKRNTTYEGDIRAALDAFSDTQVAGRWAKSITGIGPVIAAGLLAHIDISKAPSAGAIWRFAGLDPTNKWLSSDEAKAFVKEVIEHARPAEVDDEDLDYMEIAALCAQRLKRRHDSFMRLAAVRKEVADDVEDDGEEPDETVERPTHIELVYTRKSVEKAVSRRPWNARLKVLAWKIGESFVKQQNHQDDFYGKLFVRRKAEETERNDDFQYRDQADEILRTKKIGHDTEAYKAYKIGKLPKGQIHARAKRWTEKLFLAHYQHVAWESTYGRPPAKPYILSRPVANRDGMLTEHTHFITPPNWPMR